jgi:hypothetical protein
MCIATQHDPLQERAARLIADIEKLVDEIEEGISYAGQEGRICTRAWLRSARP